MLEAEAAIPELYTDPVSTLTHLVPACPDNKSGLQYLTSFLLLNKDIGTYMVLQESLFRTPAWPEMTDSQQEAVVICRPDDLHFWLEHGGAGFYAESKRGNPFRTEPGSSIGSRVWKDLLVLLYV